MRAITFSAWVASAAAFLFAACLPTGVGTQMAMATMVLSVMAMAKALDTGRRLRGAYMACGTFLGLRYVAWRVTHTLPPVSSRVEFAAGCLLLSAEVYCLVTLLLSMFTVADPVERPRAAQLDDDATFDVDVFVPSYNEGLDILAPTLAAAMRLDHPRGRLNVFLLDDGGTDQKVFQPDIVAARAAGERRRTLQALCADMGVTYLTRERNEQAKAGNLNHGLAHSRSELVAVLDADHAPERCFLRETVGFFADDPRLFLVQTPHAFMNRDPIERNLAALNMPSENEMFYSVIQKGLDRWNAAFFCGSAAVLRRSALEEVGGFRGESITEDAETALELHSRGWNSVYVDRPMIAGLQPETFESFIGQRSRWCRGMIQILILKNPLLKSGLTLPQRLCYLSTCIYWLFPLARMAFVVSPMLYLFLGLRVYVATQQEFIAYTVTYLAACTFLQSYVFGRFRWPFVSDLYEYIQSVMLFRAVLATFARPRSPRFNVTDKGLTLEVDRMSELAAPYFALFGLVLASLGVLAWRFATMPDGRGSLLVLGGFTLMNLMLAGIALGAVCERRERRSMPRVGSSAAAWLSVGDAMASVDVDDMSYGGLRVVGREALSLPPGVEGTLWMADGAGGWFKAPVMSASRPSADAGQPMGLRFHGAEGDRYRMVADVIYTDLSPFWAERAAGRCSVGILQGLCILSWWLVAHTGRGLYFAARRRDRRAAMAPTPAPRVAAAVAQPPAPALPRAPQLVVTAARRAA